MRTLILALGLAILPHAASSQSIVEARDGWQVIATDKPYDTLLVDLRQAVRDNKMGLVTEAGPTEVAASRGETIPGNRVVGVFRNDFAVDIIRVAPSAMIEAPVRIMVMEEPDGTASLSYKRPSAVFAPYAEEGGAALAAATAELDTIFEAIAKDASGS